MKHGLLLFVALFFSINICARGGEKLSFRQKQMRYPRVRSAVDEKQEIVKRIFKRRGIAYPPSEIFIRVFKDKYALELWARSGRDEPFKLIKQYKVCNMSGGPGPKRKQGDHQVPEGFYYIDRFNPQSRYQLSLGINYPNQSDRILGVKGKLGGDIFIHGGCGSIGCIAITDERIKELYVIAVEARSSGQVKIPVHIFPARLDEAFINESKWSWSLWKNISFWENLERGYDIFESTKRLPTIKVDGNGKYVFQTND